MGAKGYSMGSAQAAMLAGDSLFNAKSYKAAYKQYQRAYLLAVL
jgi:hypothetical protein